MSGSLEGLTPLEESLARLVPVQGGLSRDHVLFEAGRASARPARAWPLLAAGSALTAAVLGVLLLTRPGPQVIERTTIVRVPESAPSPAPEKPSTGSPVEKDEPSSPAFALGEPDHLRRRQEVLRWGVEVLPSAPPRSPLLSPLTPGSLRQFPDLPSTESKLF
jgi:hypothetical protein